MKSLMMAALILISSYAMGDSTPVEEGYGLAVATCTAPMPSGKGCSTTSRMNGGASEADEWLGWNTWILLQDPSAEIIDIELHTYSSGKTDRVVVKYRYRI